MANKKITDLMSGTPVRDSLLESAIDISGTMDSRKVKAGVIADLASANVAAPYDTTVTYAIGQYCLYEGDIYRCIAITTGAFDSTAWTQIVVTGEFRRVVELTSAQYTALSSAEKNNGTLYVITDEETTAADIPYSAGVSVADKLDNVPTFDTLTTSDNNKLLGVSVSGSDISVGAVAPIIDVDGSTICVSHISNIYTVSLKNCTIANAYTHLAPYTTSKILRFVTWNTTNTHPVMVNMGENTVTLIDCTTWQIIPNTNTDTIHGSATYIKI